MRNSVNSRNRINHWNMKWCKLNHFVFYMWKHPVLLLTCSVPFDGNYCRHLGFSTISLFLPNPGRILTPIQLCYITIACESDKLKILIFMLYWFQWSIQFVSTPLSPTKSSIPRLVKLDIHLTSNSDLAQMDRHQALLGPSIQCLGLGVQLPFLPYFFAQDCARIWQENNEI